MKKLTHTLCLTIVVLLGNVLFANVAIATDYLSAQFGNVTLKLPTPENLCLIGNSELERTTLDYAKQTQSVSKGKLLSLWIDCDTQKKLQNGIPTDLEEWVILSAYMTGNPPREKTYPRITKKVFLKKMLGTNEPDFGLIQKKVNKNISKINKNVLGDKNAILLGKPLNLGVLAVTDSIHKGVIITANSELFVGIFGSTILKGVLINFFYYKSYIDKDSIKETLSKSKIYSAFLHNSNRHGHFTVTYPNGDKYVGEFKDNKKHGQGIYTFANGKKLVGEFKDGKSIQGTLTFRSTHKRAGEKYVGKFNSKGIEHGTGTLTYPDGEKYVGGFKDGRHHGNGIITSPDGEVTRGIWENGKFKSERK